jgi:hypothetical protein
MEMIRQSILEDSYHEFKDDFLRNYQPTDAETRTEQKRRWLESRLNKQALD